VNGWFRARWDAFRASYDAPEAAVQSSPGTIFIGLTGTSVGMLVIGYMPGIAQVSQFRAPWLPILTMLLASSFSYLAYKNQATGRLGTACMLIDTLLYSSTFSLATALTSSPFSLVFAVAECLFLIVLPGSTYALTLLIALAMCVPPVLISVLFTPPPTVAGILWFGSTLSLLTSFRTGQRRALTRQNQQLRTALGATTRVADESVDVAIGTSLLDVGNLLHELRNLQAVQRMNLDFLAEEAALDESCAAALRDVITARSAEEALIARALADIRRRSQGSTQTFQLQAMLSSVIATCTEPPIPRLVYRGCPFFVTGNPEYLRLIVHNLVRNASQAGATEITIRASASTSTSAVSLEIIDNGPGIPEGLLGKQLFQPFSTSGKQNGTGLGLYLVKRYVELMGGQIEVENQHDGGARFRISLPGRVANEAMQPPPQLPVSRSENPREVASE